MSRISRAVPATAVAIIIELAGCAAISSAVGLGSTGTKPSAPDPGGSVSDASSSPEVRTVQGAADTPPAWCKKPEINQVRLDDLAALYTETEAHRALYTLVAATCNPDNEARSQARQIEATRRAWSKKLHLTEADWDSVAEFVVAPLQSRINGMVSRTKDNLAFSAYSGLDQYEALMRNADPSYLADTFGERLSQAGRLAYITRCLKAEPLVWAMCQPDIEAFDAEKLAVELRTDTHGGFDRIRASIAAFEIRSDLAAHATEVKALLAKDAGYGTMFELAKAARKDWMKVDPALLAIANAMEDAEATNSRKASEGCGARTWSAWSGYVASLPAKQFSGFEKRLGHWFEDQAMAKISGTPNGYLASLALVRCSDLTGEARDLVQFLERPMGHWPGFRGPRTMAHTAVLAANIALDDRGARIDSPSFLRHGGRMGDTSRGGTGTIGAIERMGDTAKITFSNIKGTQPKCVRGHYTNRVVQLRDDGVLVYEYVCVEERLEAYSEPPAPPQNIDGRYAAGLEPGMFVTTIGSIVSVAYRKGSQMPVRVFGVAVK